MLPSSTCPVLPPSRSLKTSCGLTTSSTVAVAPLAKPPR